MKYKESLSEGGEQLSSNLKLGFCPIGKFVFSHQDVLRYKKSIEGPYIHHVAGVYGSYSSAVMEACKYINGLEGVILGDN